MTDRATQDTTVLWKKFDELGSLGDPNLRVEVLTNILRINPNDANAHFKIAYLYYNNSILFGDRGYVKTKTMQNLNRAIELDPKHVGALFLRGAVRFDARDRTGAVSDWRSVIAVDPKSGYADMARNALADLGIKS
jgi:cytochrome c-type biogenesis protein CcmH/NrfG